MASDKNLDELREEIRAIDKKLAQLFEERMELSRAIGICKEKASQPVYDARREEENIAFLSALLKKASHRPYFIRWYQMLMDISKDIQRKTKK